MGIKMHTQMPQVEVNIQTYGEINAQTDASRGGKFRQMVR
jgi:hypothetical protein